MPFLQSALQKLRDEAEKDLTTQDKRSAIIYKLCKLVIDEKITTVNIIDLHKAWVLVIQLKNESTQKKDEDLRKNISNFLEYILSHFFSGNGQVDGMVHQIFRIELYYGIPNDKEERIVIRSLLNTCDKLQKKMIKYDRWEEEIEEVTKEIKKLLEKQKSILNREKVLTDLLQHCNKQVAGQSDFAEEMEKACPYKTLLRVGI